MLGTTNDKEWQRLARTVLGRDDLADDERFGTNADRVAHRDEVDAAIAAWCAGRTLADVQMLADEAGIGNARLNRPTEVVAHPQLVERQRWRPVELPNGPVDSLLPPPIISGYDPPMGAVPALGEHTAAILAELGLPGADPGPLGGA